MRSMICENIQLDLEGMGLDFSKYNTFKAHQQSQKYLKTLNEINEP